MQPGLAGAPRGHADLHMPHAGLQAACKPAIALHSTLVDQPDSRIDAALATGTAGSEQTVWEAARRSEAA